MVPFTCLRLARLPRGDKWSSPGCPKVQAPFMWMAYSLHLDQMEWRLAQRTPSTTWIKIMGVNRMQSHQERNAFGQVGRASKSFLTFNTGWHCFQLLCPYIAASPCNLHKPTCNKKPKMGIRTLYLRNGSRQKPATCFYWSYNIFPMLSVDSVGRRSIQNFPWFQVEWSGKHVTTLKQLLFVQGAELQKRIPQRSATRPRAQKSWRPQIRSPKDF